MPSGYWLRCRHCGRERRVKKNKMVRHRRWDGRKMIWCPGSGDPI